MSWASVLRPLEEELARLQARNEALELELKSARYEARVTERRLRAQLAKTLDQPVLEAEEGILPPPDHPFWREAEAPSAAIRALADERSARLRAEAQLEVALEARRTLLAQLRDARLSRGRDILGASGIGS